MIFVFTFIITAYLSLITRGKAPSVERLISYASILCSLSSVSLFLIYFAQISMARFLVVGLTLIWVIAFAVASLAAISNWYSKYRG